MTPDRDALIARRPSPATAGATSTPAEEIAAAVARVPAPRPEVLARVLEGLRELPADTADPARRAPDGGTGGPLPLPRRRS